MSRGLLLGRDGQPAPQRLEILVPRGYEQGDVVIVGKCLVPGCGAIFREGEEAAWQRHVGQCARANMDRIQATVAKLSVFEDWDPEVSAYFRQKVRPRMEREGRYELKPREYTGTLPG